jgi:hypothetical protein
MDGHEYLVQGNLRLGRGSLLRIEDGRDMLLYVWSGALWITQEGDPRDRLIPAGGWFRITSAGLTLISGFRDSVITLTSARESGFAERVDMVGPGSIRLPALSASGGRFSALRARLVKHWLRWFAPQARPTTASL